MRGSALGAFLSAVEHRDDRISSRRAGCKRRRSL
jgi:hypothetical protein